MKEEEEEEEEMVMEEEELKTFSYCFQSYHKTKEMEHQKKLPLTYHTMPIVLWPTSHPF